MSSKVFLCAVFDILDIFNIYCFVFVIKFIYDNILID